MTQNIIAYLPQQGVMRLRYEGGTADVAVDKTEMARGSFFAALEEAIASGKRFGEAISADFILPHSAYGVDYITLPNVKRGQLEEAYKAQLRSLYKNYNDIVFQKTEIHTGKTVTFRVIFARRSLLRELKEGLEKLGVHIARFIPQGIALYEGMVKLQPSLKKSPCVLLNADVDEGYLAAYGNETLLGGLPVPFGFRALSDSKVVHERQLFRREAAELLVLNANERAKSSRLTMAIDLEEGLDDENEESQEQENGEDAARVSRPFAKALYRSLPKNMRRAEPTDAEGFVLENFRLFEKRILMLLREMALREYYQKIETVCVALPPQFEWLADRVREENPALKWVFLNQSGSDLLFFGAQCVGDGKAVVF